MTQTSSDPFAKFKSAQRDGWSHFLPLEDRTIIPAAKLVAFAGVSAGQSVLDVACGTGVVAVTAARVGAKVKGLDLTPPLLDRARYNADVAEVAIDFVEGDAEALPYADGSFDVVLSQFGHMFAPRPQVVIAEMLRVLKPGGRIAFATWPPEHYTGKMFALVGKYAPPPPAGAPAPSPPPQWGDPGVVRERLGDAVKDLFFEREMMTAPVLSPAHGRVMLESTLGPLIGIVAALKSDPPRLASLRAELDALVAEVFVDNHMRQHFLLSRATKR
jgi:SAM-dependent methyltransferase